MAGTAPEQEIAAVDADDQAREADVEAINEVVATIEHSQNNELVEEFVGLFRADAIWTTGHGRRLFGRDAIEAFTRQVLPGAMSETTVTLEVEHVLFLRPDVAAVKVRQVFACRSRSNRLTYRMQPDVRDDQGGRALDADRLPEHGGRRR